MHLYRAARTAFMMIVVAGVASACAGLLPFSRIDGTDPSAIEKMEGSWTVMNSGGEPIENMEPHAVIVFDTAAGSVSGFDGCKNFKGSYSFDQGLLKAQVAGTKRACTSDSARKVSGLLGELLASGAEVVDTSMMGTHVLMLKNANGDLRMGPTAMLDEK